MTGTASPEPAPPTPAHEKSEEGIKGQHDNANGLGQTVGNGTREEEFGQSHSSPRADELQHLHLDSLPPKSDNDDDDAAAVVLPGRNDVEPPKTNGHTLEHDDAAEERPAKRRRVRESTPPNSALKKKPESPPWRKANAEGPSSFTEGGRRKSGRINTIPIELQKGDKRITRRALHGQQGSPPSKNRYASTNGQPTAAQKSHPSTRSATKPAPTKPSSTKPATRRTSTHEPRTSARARKQSPSPPPAASPTRATNKGQRASRHVRETVPKPNSAPTRQSARIQPQSPARVRSRTTRHAPLPPAIPFVHPEQAKVQPRLGPTFEEYWERAGNLPIEQGGLLASDDAPRLTDEMALKEARLLIRIEREAEPGGLLSQEKCTEFRPDPEEEPPRQWAHMDHLVKAMANFRKLLLLEQQRHRATAKRLADACRDEWLRRQPKTADEIEAEQRAAWIATYRVVVRSVFGTWDNVKSHVNRRRLEEWEIEEQKRVKAALNQAVSMSELKLQARKAHFGSEGLSDESGDEDEDADGDDEDSDLLDDSGLDSDLDAGAGSAAGSGDGDSDNMSSSDDDDDDHKSDTSDAGLTQEQLLEKYANIPKLTDGNVPSRGENNGSTDGQQLEQGEGDDSQNLNDDTSDESVDMDDDMGSSDDEIDTGEEGEGPDEEGDGDEDEDDEEQPGLLGLLFGKSELKKLKEEVSPTDPEAEGEGASENVDGDVEKAEAYSTVESPSLNANGGVGYEDDDEIILVRPPKHLEGSSLPDGGVSDVNEATLMVAESFESDSARPSALKTEESDPGEPETAPDFSEGASTRPLKSLGQYVVEPTYSGMDMDVENGQAQEQALPMDPTSLPTNFDTTKDGQGSKGNSNTTLQDVSMVDDAINVTDTQTGSVAVPEGEVIGAPLGVKLTSPETDAVTNQVSASRSQSPRTSETKPSDVETVSSVEQSVPQSAVSRSSSQPTTSPKTEVPFLLRGTLREYQHYGLDWLAGLYANNTNGILADEMGLGKTIQTIALLAHLACQHEVWGPHLVIVPTSVMLNWEMEFKKWCPGFKILAYYGTQEERKRKRQGWTNDDVWNVCITSYQLVLQDQQVFRRRRWHYMILDEAHNIKNFKSQRWQTLLTFNTRARLLLTGTPLQNNLTELWSLLFFLMPSENDGTGFADLQEFRDWFQRPESQILENGREQMDDEARAIIAKLHKVLRPYLLRRLKADVEKQMPAKYEHVEFCRLSKRQRELYDGFLARSDTRHTLASGNYLSIINCLMQLRKVCNHPDLFVDRPIMTSVRLQHSVPHEYESTERLVRRGLLASNPMSVVSLGFLNLIPTQHETTSHSVTDRIQQLSSHRILLDLREAQKTRAQYAYTNLSPATVKSNIVYLESASRWGRFEELQHCVYVNALRRQRRPIYGKRLIERLTIGLDRRPQKPRPKIPQKIMSWFEEDSFFLNNMVPTLDQRAASMQDTITKFACVTPAVVTRDLDQYVLGKRGVEAFHEMDLKLSAPVKYAPFMQREPPLDPWHESRMRLTIQFPDKRLLQYDCGKLQALDKLLRKLQAGGHRALIFTQMTKVLDILELFLNIHGHKYLRLDGATKVEQRQILTDRFNHDTRILCFILSTRSGGLGINLTGADTVIFYDQDWNPAMDKQCQDRCHRIGQTRDVHIYRLVSEHTIEANILRKASQKQMLDDVVIQEGEFTTDYFSKMTVRDAIDNPLISDGDAAANAAMDRVLGGVESTDQRKAGRVLEQAEDREDVAAARVAEKEITTDEADFSEKAGGGGSGISSARPGTPRDESVAPSKPELESIEELMAPEAETEHNVWGERVRSIDDYMVGFMTKQLEGTPLELPKDKKKGKKKGKDIRKR